MKSKQTKADVNPVRRTAFNKENAPELLGQLVRVLKSQGMDDALQAIKSCGLTKKLNDEWMDDTSNRKRKRRASSPSRVAAAAVTPVRQRTQFTCMSTSLMMCLQALGHKVTEDEVNDVMGARPKKGAAWENALAAAQHYGCRATLVTPSTVQQLKEWTDAGIPVMIAWNPEGRPWSHASVVFDVDDDLNVYVADPNIPDPDETVRIVPKAEFYSKWSEKWPDYIVRRPAMAVEREITPEGRQVMASTKPRGWKKTLVSWSKEYKTPEGKNLGVMTIDRGKVNWRPNQLIEGFVRPQVISRSRSGEEIPSNEKLSLVADAWVKKNYGRRAKTASGSPLMTMPDYGLSMEERWERGFQEPKTASSDLGVRALEQNLSRDVQALWKVLSKQYDRISMRVDDHKFIAFYYKDRNDGSAFVDEVIDHWGPIARKHKLRTKPQHKGDDFVSFGLPRRAFGERSRIVANDTDSGAGSDEDMFFKAPDKREVLEFARSKAISNSMDVAIDHAKELDIPLLEELADVAVSPPLPTEIAREPGGKALSTLNRYVVKTEDPAAVPAVKMNQDRMAFWKAELETR